jgi:hypothetical protein
MYITEWFLAFYIMPRHFAKYRIIHIAGNTYKTKQFMLILIVGTYTSPRVLQIGTI